MVSTSRILGPDGQPIRIAELREPQTAHLTALHHEVAGHPSRGLTPSKLARILDVAEQGDIVGQYELFEDMEEKDGHIMAEMGKRRGAVKQLDWDIVAPDNATPKEQEAAATLYKILQGLDDFENIVFDVTDAIGKGFACLEFDGWQRIDGDWLPKAINHRPQTWFQLTRGATQQIHLRGSAGGAALQPFGWITHIHKAKSGYLERSALMRVLVWPYLFKNYSVGDLAEFLEIYGIPMRVGKYPSGATEREKLTLLRALASLGHNAAGIIPMGMELDFLKAAEGDPAAFKLMIEWCEKTQSKAILGGTLTSQADGASSTNALGNVHNEVRKDLRDGDAKQVAATLSRDLIYPIAVLNGLADSWKRCPRLRFDVQEPEDLKAYAEALPGLVQMGFKIPRQWAQERLAIPEPSDGEDVLGTAAAEPELTAARAALTAQRPAAPTTAAQQLEDALQPITGQWIERIRQLTKQAATLEELRDLLITALPEMSLDQYAEAMAHALAAAALQGRYEIVQEMTTASKTTALSYNSAQPRVPAGHKNGGQWMNDEKTPEPLDGHLRLYHGSNASDIDEVEDKGPFRGLFTSPRREAADSHRLREDQGELYYVDLPPEQVLTQRMLDYELSHETVVEALKDSWRIDDGEFDVVYAAVVEDGNVFDMDEDTVLKAFGADDLGEASWTAQKVRGRVARKLGYKAVAMNDEHGTSYLVLPGAKMKPYKP